MDPITFLKDQHRETKTLLGQIAKAPASQKKEIFGVLARKLAAHMEVEEEILYPAAEAYADDDTDENFEDHAEAKGLVGEILHLEPTDIRFADLVTELEEKLDRHIQKEEAELFPRWANNINGEEMINLYADMKDMSERVEREDMSRYFSEPRPSKDTFSQSSFML